MTITGVDELLKNIDILQDNIVRDIKKAINEVADEIVKIAKQNVPEKSGLLKEEIVKKVSIRKKNGLIQLVGIKKGAGYYGYFVHQGTKRIKVKQPFLLNAIESSKEQLLNKIMEAVKKHVH